VLGHLLSIHSLSKGLDYRAKTGAQLRRLLSDSGTLLGRVDHRDTVSVEHCDIASRLRKPFALARFIAYLVDQHVLRNL
jgi:hypothetical protein